MDACLRELALKLQEIGAVKFGEYKMKSGLMSPVYFDLRQIVSYPEVLEKLGNLLNEVRLKEKLPSSYVCGVPYTALPIATQVSVNGKIPMVMRRKEKKDYGTKKLIEGRFNPGDNCLIIEDIITSGGSVLETATDLRNDGLLVTTALVIIDREQGGQKRLQQNGIQSLSLYTMSSILEILQEAQRITPEVAASVLKYVAENKFPAAGDAAETTTAAVDRRKIPFGERATMAKNPLARELFQLMEKKKSNLCLAADLTNAEDILNLAAEVGPYISVLKLHVDAVKDYSKDFISSLQKLAEKHKFFLFEDRKFADIGNTVVNQYQEGIFQVSTWADIVTSHVLPGAGILKGLSKVMENCSGNRGVFVVAQLSSEGSLTSVSYAQDAIKLTQGFEEYVTGFVCQDGQLLKDHPGVIQLIPGVKIDASGDGLGQQYNSPATAIGINGGDLAVVGRGICEAKNAGEAAEQYRKALWEAYINRIQ